MPLYDYECAKCGARFEEEHKIDDRELPLANKCAVENCGGDLFISLGALGFIDPIRAGITKTPGWFNDKLKEIKKRHPLGNIKTKN